MTDVELSKLLGPDHIRELLSVSDRATEEDVQRAIHSPRVGIHDFAALISPAALPFLEEIAQRAHRITRERFGKVVGLYAPVYVSNECTNSCVYCGFNHTNDLLRTTLTVSEARQEAKFLWDQGFRNILLVSGEHPLFASVEYLVEIVRAIRDLFPSIGIEVYPLSTEEYQLLGNAGVESVTIYQETYDTELYASVHPKGRKRDFYWRLETPGRAGQAGLRRVGIGALLGLGPWRFEAIALALHAGYLQKKYWRTSVSISFPRMRSAAGGFAPPMPVGDKEMLQMILALRLLHPDAGLTLSTRESAKLRDGLGPLCMTMMSAGSRTEPGGYANPGEAAEQFRIEDSRTPMEVAAMLTRAGLEPVWKDWDGAFTSETATPVEG